ncbi:MAG: tRNA (guanosine(46)-N7)-methyltransferase TrmB [Clostridiales bacterium]|nr:tRNA (guanosine(46)-N7)-methyltransferase TrmB [Clostridiales bacterium]
MRVRFDKNAANFLNEENIHINNSIEFKGKWKTVFKNDNKIYLEIGMGKGDFLVGMAKKYPDVNFIGIERNVTILAKACKKILNENLTNVRIISDDANILNEIFEKNEIDKIFLNFSDPWPKSKHAKRRLTYSSFLNIYDEILKNDGLIEFKTDNQLLFEFTIQEVNNTGRKIEYISLDLHSTDCKDNIMTEYEEKFSKKGNRIYKLIWNNINNK